MRGKATASIFSRISSRITPAYAGKSLRSRRFAFEKWDHPRLCGEKAPLIFCEKMRLGSPPPMRGKVFTASTPCVSTRITPAYAGKSLRSIPDRNEKRDHPRLCGEKIGCVFVSFGGLGSPPPMRGKVGSSDF